MSNNLIRTSSTQQLRQFTGSSYLSHEPKLETSSLLSMTDTSKIGVELIVGRESMLRDICCRSSAGKRVVALCTLVSSPRCFLSKQQYHFYGFKLQSLKNWFCGSRNFLQYFLYLGMPRSSHGFMLPSKCNIAAVLRSSKPIP